MYHILIRPDLIVSYLILDYFIRTEYFNFVDKPVSAWAAADAECLSVPLPAPPWPPEVLRTKAHCAGKAREFFPFHLALPDAIPQPPIGVVTVTSAIPDYLQVQPKCKPGVCDSALLYAAMLQSSSLNHFDKARVCRMIKQPLYFDIPMIWMALTRWREEGCSHGEVPEWAGGDFGKLSACLSNSYLRNDPSKCSFLWESASVLKQIRFTAFSVSEESWSRMGISMNWCNFFFLKILIYRKGVWNQNIDMILI